MRSRGRLEIPHVQGDLYHHLHAAPYDADLSPKLGRNIYYLLDPWDVGGEGRDDNAALGLLEHLGQGFAHNALGRGVSRTIGVSAVGQKGQDSPLAGLGQLEVVGWLARSTGVWSSLK